MDYKYDKVEEIKQLPKYKQLLEAVRTVMKEYSAKNRYDAYPLYEWYINQLLNCKECHELFDKEFPSRFIDVKDIDGYI